MSAGVSVSAGKKSTGPLSDLCLTYPVSYEMRFSAHASGYLEPLNFNACIVILWLHHAVKVGRRASTGAIDRPVNVSNQVRVA